MIGKLITGLILIAVAGLCLYLSPLRGDTVAIVGVFASLSAVIIALLATTEIEVLTVEEGSSSREMTSQRGSVLCEILSHTGGSLSFGYTNMSSVRKSEFDVDVYSSEHQVTLSSHYMPTRAIPVGSPRKKRVGHGD